MVDTVFVRRQDVLHSSGAVVLLREFGLVEPFLDQGVRLEVDCSVQETFDAVLASLVRETRWPELKEGVEHVPTWDGLYDILRDLDWIGSYDRPIYLILRNSHAGFARWYAEMCDLALVLNWVREWWARLPREFVAFYCGD